MCLSGLCFVAPHSPAYEDTMQDGDGDDGALKGKEDEHGVSSALTHSLVIHP